ncbi:MAG TPA: hypothetical protein PK054_05785 [Anaerohalosphaeraceae bacterium]|nr:hypothetical protein [Anaerohalosphaeraceae bacterium]HOL88218.1 hypothetical protein [Anaerohalosphaeraceae bacterium]HPP56077.1 hypothetical protein [Anaerohalosphaeraceae bacterium]
MLKALRIASMAAVISAVVVLAAVAILGFRGDPDIEAFLAKEGVVEQFRKKSQTVPAAKADAVSPLEQAAKAFALRIDPPPPPPPPKPIEPPKPPEVKPPQLPKPPEHKQPTLSAKFTLIATARYPEHPEKSMALLQNVQNEYKWYRQGEQVGHLVIQEIKDGSIVLYQGGKFNSELFMPAATPTKSLLKSDEQIASSAPTGPTSLNSSEVSEESGEGPEAGPSAASAEGKSLSRPQIPRIPRPQPTSAPPRITTTLRTSEELPAVEMSPEEQIRSIDESISAIQNIMRQTPQEGQTEEERQAEQQAWQELLKVLAKEKETAVQSAQQAKKPAEQTAEGKEKEEAKPAPSEEGSRPESTPQSESSEKIE